MHLREEDKEFPDPSRLRSLVRKYSDHLSFPHRAEDGRDRRHHQSGKGVLDAGQIRIEGRGLPGFYKHLSHDSETLARGPTNRVEGNIEYTSLLYLPKRAPFDLFEREPARRIQLYVKRVFVMDRRPNCCRLAAFHAGTRR